MGCLAHLRLIFSRVQRWLLIGRDSSIRRVGLSFTSTRSDHIAGMVNGRQKWYYWYLKISKLGKVVDISHTYQSPYCISSLYTMVHYLLLISSDQSFFFFFYLCSFAYIMYIRPAVFNDFISSGNRN